MTNNIIELLSYVKRGRQRGYIFKHTTEKPQTVSEIMKWVNKEIKNILDGKEIRLRDVSRGLKQLADNGLVVCLNPSKRKGVRGILYKLTKKGKEIKMKFFDIS